MSQRGRDACADIESERLWIACVLLDARTLETATAPPEDFWVRGHELVVRAMYSLRRAQVPVDTVTIRVELDREGNLKRVGDEMLLALTNQVPNTSTAFALAGRIRELAEMRRRREHAQKIIDACDARQLEEARILSATISASYDPHTVKVMNFREVTQETLQAYQDLGTERDKSVKLGMGTAVDDMWSAYPGSLTVIGAQTGAGKTSVMCSSALSLGRRGVPVGVISVEDPAQDFGGKWLGELGPANPSRFWRKQAEAAEHERAIRAAAEHENLPIYFAHIKSRKLDDVLSAMRTMARRYHTRVTKVDYLQVIRPREWHKDRRDGIDSVLDDLIVESSMLDQALVLASQISREGAKQNEPRVQDLKESGTIENRAQTIVLIWPDEKKKDTVHGKIAKVKNTTTGRRFTLIRNTDTGALAEESDDVYAPAPQDDGDPGPAGGDDNGYAVGGYGKKKK